MLTAPVAASAGPPPCTALVSNPSPSRSGRLVTVTSPWTRRQNRQHVRASDDSDRVAAIENQQGRCPLQPPHGHLDLLSGPDGG